MSASVCRRLDLELAGLQSLENKCLLLQASVYGILSRQPGRHSRGDEEEALGTGVRGPGETRGSRRAFGNDWYLDGSRCGPRPSRKAAVGSALGLSKVESAGERQDPRKEGREGPPLTKRERARERQQQLRNTCHYASKC